MSEPIEILSYYGAQPGTWYEDLRPAARRLRALRNPAPSAGERN